MILEFPLQCQSSGVVPSTGWVLGWEPGLNTLPCLTARPKVKQGLGFYRRMAWEGLLASTTGHCSYQASNTVMQILFMLHTLLMLRVKLQRQGLYCISDHKMLKALSWAVLVLEGKMTLLLFQLIQVKLSRRGRRLKLVHLDQP